MAMYAESPAWVEEAGEEDPFDDPSIGMAQGSRPAPLAAEAPRAPGERPQQPPARAGSGASGRTPDGKLPNDWIQMRAANVIGVVLMCLTGFLNFFFGASLTVSILSLYAMSFGCMLCCFELRMKIIASFITKNFGFMNHAKGRVLFLLLCGFLMFSLESVLGWVVGSYLCALVPANVYILLKYPDLEKETIDYKKDGMAAAFNYKMGLRPAAAVV